MKYKHENTSFGDNCIISDCCDLVNVKCADNVIINDGVSMKNVVIGSNTKVSRLVTLYSPFDDKPVLIGNDVWLSHGVFGEATGGQIIVNNYSVLAHFSTMLTSSGPGKRSYLLHEIYPEECGPIIIGEHCWLGANSTILPNVILPEGIVIAANSVIKEQEFREWSLYAGSPGIYKKSIK